MEIHVLGPAILIDPSGRGDKNENAEKHEKSCKTCGYPHARGGLWCPECQIKWQHCLERSERNINLWLSGTEHPIHTNRYGYLNPNDSEHRKIIGDGE